MDKYIGKKLDGRYEILELVGFGGMAVVFKAYDLLENRHVAVKILKDEYLHNEEFRRRFRNESKAIAMLSHPNIVRVFDVNFSDTVQYIVMEYIDGITLKEYIGQQGAVKWKETIHFTVQILRALQHAHDNGIVHRDIKPQNVMLLQDGTIKVMDFGIAHVQNYSTITISDKAIGTVHYISPEQAKGRPADERSDIYSTGVILYEMLTGKLPFDADSAVSVALMQVQQKAVPPSQIVPDIPPAVEHIVMKAMRKNVEARYQNAGEMLADIEKFKENPDVILETTPPKEEWNEVPEEARGKKQGKSRYVRRRTQNRWLFAVVGISAAAVLLIVFVLVMLGISDRWKSGYENVPKYVGLMMNEITAEDTQKFVFRYHWQDSDEPEGKIVEQDPDAGKYVEKGSEIVLYISNGNSPYTTVPEGLTGVPEEQAIAVLNALGINYKVQDVYISDTPLGQVVWTSPSAGANIDRNDTLTLGVNRKDSSGADEVAIPSDILGMSLDSATALLDSLEIKYTVQKAASNRPEGLVASTNPSPGERVKKGTVITIFISTGHSEEPTTEPNEPTTDPNEPTTDPNEPTTEPPTEPPTEPQPDNPDGN